MVGSRDFTVYLAFVRLPIAGTHDVVNSDKKTCVMVADTGAISTCHITVGQVLGHRAMRIGNRTVIEVTAKDGAHVLVLLDVLRHSLCLRCSLPSRLSQLNNQEFRGLFRRIRLQFSLD